jgi:predicted DNA-binding transcriptional regulator YafY
LNALGYAGFQIYSDQQGKQVRWFLNSGSSLPIPLEPSELVALHAASVSASLQQLPGAEALNGLFAKMVAGLSERMREFFANVQSALVGVGPRTVALALGPRNIEGTLAQAIVNKKTVEILYQALSSGERRRRRVDPYALISAPPDLYLWAFCHDRIAMRTFHLRRMWDLRLTDQTFSRRPISTQQAFENSFEIWQGKPETVRIRFTGKAAVLVTERQWHATQRLIRVADGVDLTMQVNPAADLQKWILGFGAEAEVLQPTSLRKVMAEQLSAAARLYKTETAGRKPARPAESAPEVIGAVPFRRSRT